MNKEIKLLVLLLGLTLIVSCNHTIKQKEPEKKQNNRIQSQADSKIPAGETTDISQEKLFELFNLTKKKISASAAAKKIEKAQGTKHKNFIFEEVKAIAYNDKEGTFTVKIKGKSGEKSFNKEMSAAGFDNPYTDIFPSLDTAELDFSNAIEHNTHIDNFITQANQDIGTVLKAFSFNDPKIGKIEQGSGENYILTAKLENKKGQIKITPVYKVKHLIKERNGNETFIEENYNSAFLRLNKEFTKSYFSKNDVFKYLIEKTDDSIIKVNPDKFPSFYYAFAKHLNVTPDSLISDETIKTIMKRYNEEGGQYKMKINTAILRPRQAGIKADDYAGTIELDYCIAEEEQIEQMLHDEHINTPIVAIGKAKAAGFKKVSKENAGELFKFQIKLTDNNGSQQKWISQVYDQVFLKDEESAQKKYTLYKIYNPSKHTSDSTYYSLKVNGKAPEEIFALEEPKFFSEYADKKYIFIEKIFFKKEAGSDTLKIHIHFFGGGDEIVIESKPE